MVPVPPSSGDAGGRAWYFAGLPRREGFLALCGPHIPAPLCDRILHDYPAHRSRQALNIALRDLFERPAKVGSVTVPRAEGYASDGLRNIAIGDHTAVETFGGNLAYNFGTWGWPYWRAAWRVLQGSDAPPEIKQTIARDYVHRFGPSGMLEQDDGENWSQVSASSHSSLARTLEFNYQMGLGHERYHEDLPGAIGNAAGELTHRSFYTRWAHEMGIPVGNDHANGNRNGT